MDRPFATVRQAGLIASVNRPGRGGRGRLTSALSPGKVRAAHRAADTVTSRLQPVDAQVAIDRAEEVARFAQSLSGKSMRDWRAFGA
jgi:hypothetical protein